MKLPEEAWESLRQALIASGLSKELEAASQEDLEQFGYLLLNLTAAAVKTREKLRRVGIDLGPSLFPASEHDEVSQSKLPGFED